MGHPRALFRLFLSFQTNITIFTTNICKNVHPVYLSCWDSNPQLSAHESHPITTRPVFPPEIRIVLGNQMLLNQPCSRYLIKFGKELESDNEDKYDN